MKTVTNIMIISVEIFLGTGGESLHDDLAIYHESLMVPGPSEAPSF